MLRAGGAKQEIHPGFGSDEEVRSRSARILPRAGRRIDDASPAVDVWLPDGAHLHALVPRRSQMLQTRLNRDRSFDPYTPRRSSAIARSMRRVIK